MTGLEWFEFYAGRSTLCFEIQQPVADRLDDLVSAVQRWREVRTADSEALMLRALYELEHCEWGLDLDNERRQADALEE